MVAPHYCGHCNPLNRYGCKPQHGEIVCDDCFAETAELRTRNEVLERQRDGLAIACNGINARKRTGSWDGCLCCNRNDCTRESGCLDNTDAHEHSGLCGVRTILQEIAQEPKVRR